MLIQATQLRPGMIVNHEGQLFRIMTVDHITPGNKRGIIQTKMRNLASGLQTENRFRSEDRVEKATLEQQEMEFLYAADGQYHFMNVESFEQIALGVDLLGDAVKYLTPNLRVQVDFYNEQPIGVTLPKTVDLRITQTAPGLKSATVTNVLKPATAETGLVVPVPGFISEGDVIRVDTDTGAYLSRAKGG